MGKSPEGRAVTAKRQGMEGLTGTAGGLGPAELQCHVPCRRLYLSSGAPSGSTRSPSQLQGTSLGYSRDQVMNVGQVARAAAASLGVARAGVEGVVRLRDLHLALAQGLKLNCYPPFGGMRSQFRICWFLAFS